MINVESLAKSAHNACFELASYTTEDKNRILNSIAKVLHNHIGDIMVQNALDIQNMDNADSVFIDRLTLTEQRILNMIQGVKDIINLSDPIGEITDEWTRPNGLNIQKVRMPLGVIAIIYEARPNVTIDAASLCIKSGNAVVLRGSKGAINSNRILYKLMKLAIEKAGYNSDIIQFIDNENRECVNTLLKQDKFIDVIIPRGGEGLKHFILDNSRIPVIVSAGGNCHIFVEKTADLDMAEKVIINAKCNRPSVCNAVEHLLIDEQIADKFIPQIVNALKKKGVEIVGDKSACKISNNIKPMDENDFSTEFLDLKLSISIVKNVDEAINHINKYSTKHSEAILTKNRDIAEKFKRGVDAAVIYENASTRFTDGFEFGFGAEMGISTNKLHARGPLGLKQLTSEKYLVTGNGTTR